MTRHERYWDRMAERYATLRIRDSSAYERTLARTAAWLTPDDHVVEFGCGTGTSALRLAPSAGRVDATDFSAAMIGIATGKAQALHAGNVTFRRADIFDTEAVPGPYDAALAFNFLQLMADLPAALAAVARRLKPGGLFISKSVCLGEDGWRTARIVVRGLKAVGVLPPIQLLTIAALEGAVENAGFEIPRARPLPRAASIPLSGRTEGRLSLVGFAAVIVSHPSFGVVRDWAVTVGGSSPLIPYRAGDVGHLFRELLRRPSTITVKGTVVLTCETGSNV